jgi:uncharacterized hydrophobic protein (TIGR00271 family)
MTMDGMSDFVSGFDFRRDDAQRSATRELVASGSVLSGSYLAMNAAATMLAGFGLLENSPAVIIGAMLIAMLFRPLVGIAMGLAEANLSLLGRSLFSEFVGAAWVLAISYVVGMASRNVPVASEILSRTSPNILDLLIGLVGGIAGGFTYVSTGLTGVLVGVAIATALLPPLTSCGILLAHHLPGLAVGAFLLFLADFTAIVIGAMMVFWLAGHRPYSSDFAYKVFAPRLIALILLAVLGFHFTITFRRTVAQSLLESTIRKTLSSEMDKVAGARVVTVTLLPGHGMTVASVVVRSPQPVPPQQVARLNDLVNRVAGSTVELHVRSVITAETTREGYVYQPEFWPTEDPGKP